MILARTMEVPEIVFVAVVLPIQALVIDCPGAKISTMVPKLEKEALASAIVEAPTVIAPATRAGLLLAASLLSLPAATVTWTPLLTSYGKRGLGFLKCEVGTNHLLRIQHCQGRLRGSPRGSWKQSMGDQRRQLVGLRSSGQKH